MAFRIKHALALAAIVVTAAIQGCTSGQSAEAYGKVGANTGTVYVSRPSQLVASGTSMNVKVNGNAVGSIGNGGCIRVTLPAGRHTIGGTDMWTEFLKSDRGGAHVDVRPGASTYVLITPTMHMPGQYFTFPANIMASGRRC